MFKEYLNLTLLKHVLFATALYYKTNSSIASVLNKCASKKSLIISVDKSL